ncbi:hypothetical protein AUP68_10538 [Ilyonectria robusta]
MDTETTTQDQSATGLSCPTLSSLDINNVNINEPPGVTLSPHEKLIVGSLLDVRPATHLGT